MNENEKLIQIRYRNWLHGIPPKRVKLDIDGWAGENTWKIPQPWHCKPYADANTYGLELVYSWQTTCTVTCDEKGHCTFEGNFSQEVPEYLGKEWHPFACFAPFHFGYVSMVDIKTPDGNNLMVMPHPRFYSDRDGSIPCAVPGMLEMDWWPEIFFIVFKAPLPGKQLVFKHNDPIAQFLVLPRNIKYEITPMTEAEEVVRAQRQSNLENNWNRLCTRVFYCEDGKEFFDNKYKVLSNIARKDGNGATEKIMDEPKTIPHWAENPTVVDHRVPNEDNPIHHNPWTEEDMKKMKEEKQITNEQLEEMYDPMLLKDIDKIIDKNVKDEEVTDAELEKLVADFKMSKRQRRQERSQKLRDKADPKVILANQRNLHPKPPDQNKQQPNMVLGHKIEKLI